MKIFNSYKTNSSSRGLFMGIINFGDWEEVNYIETEANQVRGNHYHKKATEVFFILEGEIDIRVAKLNGEIINDFVAKKGSIFLIEPFEVHTFVCKTKCKWVNIMSKRMDDDLGDIYKVDPK